MFKNLLKNSMKAGMKMAKDKVMDIQEKKEYFEDMSDSMLMSLYRKNDLSSESLAIGTILRTRGYSFVNGQWKK